MTRFLVIPIYYVSAWAIIQTLGAPAHVSFEHADKDGIVPKVDKQDPKDKAGRSPDQPLRLNNSANGEGATVGFVVVWLATSALQLITAPLVEPRYFILPWVMWRLRVPRDCSDRNANDNGQDGKKGWIAGLKTALWDQHDNRLWLETAWFLFINAVTGYVFLYKGFEWQQEVGKVQRFMW